MSDPIAQLEHLRQSLGGYGDSDAVPANLGDVFNALLTEAKRNHPADAVVAAVAQLILELESRNFSIG